MERTRRNMGLVRSLARLYTFYTPIKKGSYRLAAATLDYGGEIPERLLIDTVDGCRLVVNPADEGYRFTYFLGDYEPAVSRCIRNCVQRGDVCLDIGANAGWFTALLMKLSGKEGEVHAFEPIPSTFERLKENISLNQEHGNAIANKIALGNEAGRVRMFIGEGMPDGHASVASESNGTGECVEAVQKTLDSYLEEHCLEQIDFVKADIEGSELAMLQGASRLFDQEIPPVFEIEMALATSERFGYKPNDLISFIMDRRPYEFYEISEHGQRLTRIKGFEPSSIGANVLCVPANAAKDKKLRLGIL